MKNLKTKSFILIVLISIILVSLIYFSMIVFKSKNSASAETYDSNLTFTLNSDGTGYLVRAANRQITEAIIPNSYNDLPVTEVANNGFLSCASLEKVIIPESVVKVGSNAFFSCRNLKKLRGMSNVKEIGNSAFAMCTSLTNLIIPSDVETLGSNIIRSVSNDVYVRNTELNIMSLNAEWNANSTATIIYGNDLTCTEINGEDNTLIGYSVDEYQLLDYSSKDVNLICSYEFDGQYYPIIEFSDMAFAGSEFKSLTISKDMEHIAEDYSIKLGSGAFLAVYTDYITFEIDTEIEESGVDIFAGVTAEKIAFNNAINVVPERAFQYCSNLTEIVISNNINSLSNTTVIGANAFEDCYSISELHIPSTVNYIGDSAFHNWGNGINNVGEPIKQKLIIDLNGPKSVWDNGFLGEPNYENFTVEYNKVMVMFAKDGGNGGTNYIEAMYGQDMPNAEAPQKQNFEFQGYFSELNGNGTKYYDNNMNSITAWDKAEPTILYAFWAATENKVYLDKQDGSAVTDFVKVSFNQNMPAGIVAPERCGYTFAGYFAKENGNGKKYYNAEMVGVNAWDSTTGGTIYAYWINNAYRVVFEKTGGDGGDAFVMATFDVEMPNAVAPTKLGFRFDGYFIGDKCYYDKDMQSQSSWDIPENSVLIAKWLPKTYEIELNQDYGNNKLNITVDFGADMPEQNIPQRRGYKFHGYFDAQNGKGVQYYSNEMKSLKKWETDGDGTLYAYWTIVEYSIEYQVDDWKGQTNPNPTKYTVEDEIIFENLEAEGYSFNWTPSKIDAGTINNLTVNGVWTNKPYVIILDNIQYIATFDKDMPPAPIPTRLGYTFNGYDYNGIKYYNADMTSAHIWDVAHNATLEVEWVANIYEITLITGKVEATFGEVMPNAPIPTKAGNIFNGYYTEPNGKGDMYYDADMQSVRVWDIAENTTLYAYWKQLFTITFNKSGGEGGTESVTVILGEKLPDAKSPKKIGYNFIGYSTEEGDAINYYYTPSTNNGDMVGKIWNIPSNTILYAKWAPKISTVTYLGVPNGVNNDNNASTINGDNIYILKDLEVARGYHFEGWYLNEVKVTSIYTEMGENIVLTAKISGNVIQISKSSQLVNIDSEYAIIALPSTLNHSCTINIASSVKQVYMYSNNSAYVYKININIKGRYSNDNKDFYLLLENVSFQAEYNKEANTLSTGGISPINPYRQTGLAHAINMVYTNVSTCLHLYAYGDVSIKGANGINGSDGKNAIFCQNVYIHYTGGNNKFTILGGDGSKSDTRTGNPAVAILADMTIRISSYFDNKHLIVCGGYVVSLDACAAAYQINSGSRVQYVDD